VGEATWALASRATPASSQWLAQPGGSGSACTGVASVMDAAARMPGRHMVSRRTGRYANCACFWVGSRRCRDRSPGALAPRCIRCPHTTSRRWRSHDSGSNPRARGQHWPSRLLRRGQQWSPRLLRWRHRRATLSSFAFVFSFCRATAPCHATPLCSGGNSPGRGRSHGAALTVPVVVVRREDDVGGSRSGPSMA